MRATQSDPLIAQAISVNILQGIYEAAERLVNKVG
jgi:hypothetical protein